MTIDDKHIIEAIRSNPENGFRKLLTKYKEPIYWHIRRIVVVHDDAQDAAQETFVRVFRNFNSCEGSDKLRGWIFKIATNEALRMLDKRKNATLSLDDEDTSITGHTIAENTSTVPTRWLYCSRRQSLACPQSSSWHSTYATTTK